MKNTVSEMKAALVGTDSRLDEAEGQISDLEDKVAENTPSEQQEVKKELVKMRTVEGTSAATSSVTTSTLQGYQKEKREGKRLRTYLKK